MVCYCSFLSRSFPLSHPDWHECHRVIVAWLFRTGASASSLLDPELWSPQSLSLTYVPTFINGISSSQGSLSFKTLVIPDYRGHLCPLPAFHPCEALIYPSGAGSSSLLPETGSLLNLHVPRLAPPLCFPCSTKPQADALLCPPSHPEEQVDKTLQHK
jgi:hypothetical protein